MNTFVLFLLISSLATYSPIEREYFIYLPDFDDATPNSNFVRSNNSKDFNNDKIMNGLFGDSAYENSEELEAIGSQPFTSMFNTIVEGKPERGFGQRTLSIDHLPVNA